MSVSYDGVSQVQVTMSRADITFSQNLPFIFQPTSDFTLTMYGLNGTGGINQIDNLSFSSPGLVLVPEPRMLTLAILGVGLLVTVRMMSKSGAGKNTMGSDPKY